MNQNHLGGFAEATDLTRAGRLTEATALIQRLLRGGASEPAPTGAPPERGRFKRFLDGLLHRAPAAASAEQPMTSARFTGTAGSRAYRLYVPSQAGGRPLPLLVMLHGCTQSPEDFAAGTRMNELAERHGFYVVWPEQDQRANAQRCWNWFQPGDQLRDRGEPALVAGMVREVAAAHRVDPARVYVAGMSAGGAQAAIMAEAYPDLFAAVGVHSGLACGAARDLSSALAAMKYGPATATPVAGPGVPTIVFHGDGDRIVNPVNGDTLSTRVLDGAPGLAAELEDGRTADGLGWRRARYRDGAGRVRLERWTVEGAGHAWSGGSAAGSYTEPRGPDASAAMVEFFLAHRLAGG
ncbi:MAG: PHB depolymerase family esterase [Geminicoccaceae bacterium]